MNKRYPNLLDGTSYLPQDHPQKITEDFSILQATPTDKGKMERKYVRSLDNILLIGVLKGGQRKYFPFGKINPFPPDQPPLNFQNHSIPNWWRFIKGTQEKARYFMGRDEILQSKMFAKSLIFETRPTRTISDLDKLTLSPEITTKQSKRAPKNSIIHFPPNTPYEVSRNHLSFCSICRLPPNPFHELNTIRLDTI